MKLNWNFQRNERVQNKNPSMGGVLIFSRTTNTLSLDAFCNTDHDLKVSCLGLGLLLFCTIYNNVPSIRYITKKKDIIK